MAVTALFALPYGLAPLAQLDAMDTEAFKIIAIPHVEDESVGLSLSHRRQVGDLSVFYHLLSGIAPFALYTLCLPPSLPKFLQDILSPPFYPFS